jgi:hypothetical protein
MSALDQLTQAGIAYTTTQPTSGQWADYGEIDGQHVYLAGGTDPNTNRPAGLSEAQHNLLTGLADPYLNQQNKDALFSIATGQGVPANIDPASVGVTATNPAQVQASSGSAPATPGSTAAQDQKDAANRDALAIIRQTLSQYGLPDDLSEWAWKEIVAGKSTAEVSLDLLNPQTEGGKVVDSYFPEIQARQKAGLAPLSPGDIVAYRQQARQMMQAAGLPPGFYDSNSDFSQFIIQDKSLSELSARITDASNFVYSWPAEDRQAFYDLGFSHGDAVAMALNPDIAQPLLHQQLGAARLSGAGVRSGYGALTADEAMRYNQIGVSPDQAQQALGNLTRQTELFNPLNAGETAISREEQQAAALGGNANAQQRIMDRARQRAATFAGGGSFAGSQGGLSGYGSSGQ